MGGDDTQVVKSLIGKIPDSREQSALSHVFGFCWTLEQGYKIPVTAEHPMIAKTLKRDSTA